MAEPAAPPPLLLSRGIDIDIGEVVVARGLNLKVEANQCWCILGRNGVGKTTLLHTLAGLRAPSSGSIELTGTPLQRLTRRQVAQRVGVLFQDHEDSFPASVLETVLQGRHPHLHTWQWEGAQDHRIANQALARLELSALETRNVQTLSGGERRRVGIATLFTQDTGLLLLDEPTNHLDLHRGLETLEMLAAYCRDTQRAVVMILHDINLAARFASHVLLLLGDGKARLGTKEDVLNTETLEQVYRQPLIHIDTPNGPAWLPR